MTEQDVDLVGSESAKEGKELIACEKQRQIQVSMNNSHHLQRVTTRCI